MSVERRKVHRCFEGETVFASHYSEITQTTMNFSYFRPSTDRVESVLIWLSGLTCTEENFMAKAGVQTLLAETGMAVLCPDTSPRNLNLPGEHESYDFGSGAGFYLNATSEGYRDHYRMYDYLLKELLPLAQDLLGADRLSLSGHSMGGHGALTIGLKNPELFHSISAFSPIVNPTQVPWGIKAFSGYLGDDREGWNSYDACELIASGRQHDKTILIDQGLADEFLKEQLITAAFEEVCEKHQQKLQVNYREGYDHSYYFIATFLNEHIHFHLES